MTKHPRIPALIALAVSAALGLSLLAGTGQFKSANLSQHSLEELEKRIVDSKDGEIWCAYGDKLRDVGRYPAAAKAYQRALEFRPELNRARISIAVALSQSKDSDAFFNYFSKLSGMYPKLAVDLLERPELARMQTDARWEPAASAARAQAMD